MADAVVNDPATPDGRIAPGLLLAHGPGTAWIATLLPSIARVTGARVENGSVGSSREALDALATSDATLAIVDMTIDGLRGADGWQRVREAWPRPVILLCAADDHEGVRAGLADGAEEALRLDEATEGVLGRAIARALARGRAARPEVELRDLQQRWEALDAGQSWYVMEIDGEDRITYLNRRAPDSAPVSIVGKSVFEFTHPDAHAAVRERLAHVRRTGEAVTVEERAHGTIGDHAWFVARCLPIKRDGRVTSILVVTEDVTERHRIQQLLANSERRFRALVERSSDVIVLLDRQGRTLYASPATTTVLGFAPEELMGSDFITLVHPDDVGSVRSARSTLYDGPRAQVSNDVRLRHKDGTWRMVQGVGTNLLDDPAVGAVVGNFRDVTSQRALEDQVRRAQQWEAMGLLAGGIAHDFNNLLGIIMVAASGEPMAERGAAVAAELEDIRQAAARAAELTRKLLTLARHQPLTMEYLDAAEVISDFRSLMRRTLGEDIELVVACDRPLPVRVDRLQIEQVLLNVCTNAGQAMQGRGRVVVEGQCRDGALAGERIVEIAIRDDGLGMDPATRARVFDPFFTTKSEGSGLGLTVSYGIVQRHGGSMEIESQRGHGTVVTVRLPLREGPRLARTPLERPPTATTAGVRILVVEDEATLRRILCRTLRDEGYDVIPAADGDAAVAAFDEDPDALGLVVLDVRLPGLSGPTAYKRMMSRRPQLPVLFISGHAPNSESIPAGSPLLLKPFTNEALLRAVRAATDPDRGHIRDESARSRV